MAPQFSTLSLASPVSGIYALEHLATGRRYIGSSVHIERRRRNHYSALAHQKHHCARLQRDYNACGPGGFVFLIVERVLEPELLIVEARHLQAQPRRLLYNCILTPWQTTRGLRKTPEQRARLSAALKGKPKSYMRGRPRDPAATERARQKLLGQKRTPAQIENNRQARLGRPLSPAALAHLTALNAARRGKPSGSTGKAWSPEARARLSAVLKGRPKSEATRANMRAAWQRRAARKAVE